MAPPEFASKPNAQDLYRACRDAASASEGDRRSKTFFQDELLELLPALDSDVNALLQLVQELQTSYLFRSLKIGGKICWSARPRDAASKLLEMGQEEVVIYAVIEDSGTHGTWSKKIKENSGLPQSAVTKSLGKLEKAGLIKGVRSVKAPAQRSYMLAYLTASEDVTGGSFYDAGELDEVLVEEVGNLVVWFVRQHSWKDGRRKVKRHRSLSPTADREEGHRSRRYEDVVEPYQLAYPPGSHTYPTTATIHDFLTKTPALKHSKSSQFTVAEVQSLIDVLIWDNKLEKMPAGYRTVRGVKVEAAAGGVDYGWQEDDIRPGLVEAPCGRCPVADLCSTDLESVINAKNCKYFPGWLDS